MDRAGADTLLLQRNIILGLLFGLAALCWTVLFWQRGAAGDGMAMASPTMGLEAPLFVAIWITMMVAMMFPTAAPMVMAFHHVQAAKRRRGETFVSTWVFVGAYLLVWTVAGIAAYIGAITAEMIAAATALSPAAAARIGGGTLIAAGLYQLTPLKNLCLSKCQTPMGFILTSWREGKGGAMRMGLIHGAYCLGCCWLLFVILFPLGLMNIAAMAVVTSVIFAEKSLPWGRAASRATAAALVVYGVAVITAPPLLPTFPGTMGMEMPQDMRMQIPGMTSEPADR